MLLVPADSIRWRTGAHRVTRWLIAGASGVVGRYVMDRLLNTGVRLRLLSFGGLQSQDDRVEVIRWEPATVRSSGEAALAPIIEAMNGIDVVLNLAGHSLGSGRLGRRHRQRVLQSRLDATDLLVAAWQGAATPPTRWIQASAVGYYGDTGRQWVDEDSPSGALFLSEVCRRWEQAVQPVIAAGCPTSLLRLGLILAPDAPAIVRMLRPIRLGLGGRLGSGEQFWPWITAVDTAAAIEHLAGSDHGGPINLVAPGVITQLEFTREVALALGRPAWLPAPGAALRIVAGGAVDELILPSCRARADALLDTGFEFTHRTVAEAARWMLSRR